MSVSSINPFKNIRQVMRSTVEYYFNDPKALQNLAKFILLKEQFKTTEYISRIIEKNDIARKWFYQATGIGKTIEFIMTIYYEMLLNPNATIGLFSHRIGLTFATAFERVLKRKGTITNISVMKLLETLVDAECANMSNKDSAELKRWFFSKKKELKITTNDIHVIIVNSGNPKKWASQYDMENFKSEMPIKDGCINFIVGCYQSIDTFMSQSYNVDKKYVYDTLYCDEFHTMIECEENVIEKIPEFVDLFKRVFSFSATPIQIKYFKNKNEIAESELSTDEDEINNNKKSNNKKVYAKNVKNAISCLGQEARECRITAKDAAKIGLTTPIETILLDGKTNGKLIAYNDEASIKNSDKRAELHAKWITTAFRHAKEDLKKLLKDKGFSDEQCPVQFFGFLPLNCDFLTKIRKYLINLGVKLYFIDSKNKGWIYNGNNQDCTIANTDEFIELLNGNKIDGIDESFVLDPNDDAIILNLDILNVGIDLPNVNCVYVGRAIGNENNCAKLIQCIGRGVRLNALDRDNLNNGYNAVDNPNEYFKDKCYVFFPVNILKDIEKLNNEKSHSYIQNVLMSLYDIFEFKNIISLDSSDGTSHSIHTCNTNSIDDEEEMSMIEKVIISYIDSLKVNSKQLRQAIIDMIAEYKRIGMCWPLTWGREKEIQAFIDSKDEWFDDEDANGYGIRLQNYLEELDKVIGY